MSAVGYLHTRAASSVFSGKRGAASEICRQSVDRKNTEGDSYGFREILVDIKKGQRQVFRVTFSTLNTRA